MNQNGPYLHGTIRPFAPKDLDRIVSPWLEGNLDAHSFVPEEYWKSKQELVKSFLLLPGTT